MVDRYKKVLFPLFIGIIAIIFYSPLLFLSKVPVPADTIVGLYHPYRDFYAKDYPNGIPFKNFLITDPVRQTYIWKELSVNIMKKGSIPSWNPYEMAGKPLAGNIQSSVFYPLNILFLILPFSTAWGYFIFLQTLLAGLFTYLYLKNLKLKNESSFLGSISFAFSGFTISWLTWGTVVHSVIWLPLVLLCIDKITSGTRKQLFLAILVIALSSSIFAGHPQTFMYLFILAIGYFLLRLKSSGQAINKSVHFTIAILLSLIITAVQWYPFMMFVSQSARGIDRQFHEIEGWFLPWQNLAQFIAPDYFGNPATLNYFGVFNYGEFVGYIGVIPLILVFISLSKLSRTVVFFVAAILVSLLLSLPTGISSLPFTLSIPLFSSAQPTRMVVVISFSLSVLSALGLNMILSKKVGKKVLIYLLPVALGFAVIWLFIFIPNVLHKTPAESQISFRNLIYPTAFALLGALGVLSNTFIKKRSIKTIILSIILIVTIFDLLRFSQKFTPFTTAAYLYPTTGAINYIKSEDGFFRVASLDRRILAPNFLTHYKIQSVEGYDPLYLKSYAEYIVALERGKPDISEPYGFNRIITINNYNSPLFDFLNVRFVLSLDEVSSPKLVKVFEEGDTKIYKNLGELPRTYFVKSIVPSSDSIKGIFNVNLKETAVVEGQDQEKAFAVGKAIITDYNEEQIKISTYNTGEGFLVLSDAFYPTWKAFVDSKEVKIFKTNHAFRGIFVPGGNHNILFKNSLL